MSQSFNLHRLGLLVRWTLATDRPYHIKCFGMYVAMMSIIFQMVNLQYAFGSYPMGVKLVYTTIVVMLITFPAVGGSYFFYSFHYWKDGVRELTMLPASRLEKFIVRYLLPVIVQVVFWVIGCVVADFLQNLVGLIINREPLGWLLPEIIPMMQLGSISAKTYLVMTVLILWTSSMYLLGANFIRSYRFNVLFTTIVLLVIYMVVLSLVPSRGSVTIQFISHRGVILSVVLIALTILNFWLSFRMFSRRPLIGRFINTL